MILTCDNCQKRYFVNDDEVGAKGRAVRCVACGHQWVHKSSSTENLMSKDTQTIEERQPKPAEKKQGRPFAWLFFYVVLFTSISSMYFYRAEIVQLWPQSERLYSAIGLDVVRLGDGLKVENVKPVHLEENNEFRLILTGDVLNTTDQVLPLPALKISLMGTCEPPTGWLSFLHTATSDAEAKCVVRQWEHPFAESRLLPGERITFETQPSPVTKDALSFRISF